MWKKIVIISLILSGCASLVPSDPLVAKQKLAADLELQSSEILSVRPCIFAVTPKYVRNALFFECAFVETKRTAFVARAVPKENRFEKSVVLTYSSLTGFNLRNWGLGASQLQFITESSVISVHLKSGGKESVDQPAETKRVAAILRESSVPEVESPGRVDPASNYSIPVFIPVR